MRLFRTYAVASFVVVASTAPVLAEGFPPYYGFSGYYGGPATYYTGDTDVHQTTRFEGGSSALGVRTYTAGGPFWGYKPNSTQAPRRHYRRARAIRVKG